MTKRPARSSKKKSSQPPTEVKAITHDEERRKNIPTAEYQSEVQSMDATSPIELALQRRNPDLDPQLIWRGKDGQEELKVQAPPLFIQEKIQPKALIEDLIRDSQGRIGEQQASSEGHQFDLFSDFNGIPKEAEKTDFYKHEGNWTNRMILGDSLQVMASLAEREGLRGKVQCIYFDPPYGIKFNSNFQWSTTSRDVKDGHKDHITREPEQVKAFRDTWRDGIHSYLTYLRDRLLLARELLSESGSIFVQIGDENVHRVRALMDEVFGTENLVSEIVVQKTYGFSSDSIANVSDFVLWFAKRRSSLKSRPLFRDKPYELGKGNATWLLCTDFTARGVSAPEKEGKVSIPEQSKPYNPDNLLSQGRASENQNFQYRAVSLDPYFKNSHWKASFPDGMVRLARADRIHVAEKSFRYRRFHADFSAMPFSNIWTDTGTGNFTDEKIYVVQTGSKTVERCILMATDPGDLVLDPTCGSGTTAYVAEQWGRRWITIDTSRVALALARSRLMGARLPYYLLADSPEGQEKEAKLSQTEPSKNPTYGKIRHGFVYERVPHITLKSIANNAEIDKLWEKWQQTLEPLRAKLNSLLKESWEEWQIPRESEKDWSEAAKKTHKDWWEARIGRQKVIDASIAAKAEVELLYDKPTVDKKKLRVSGPFTVESVSPHRSLGVGADGEILDPKPKVENQSYAELILESLRSAGVQQSHREDRISFTHLEAWPGTFIAAEGRYSEAEGKERRAAIMIGPEFGTLGRADLAEAAREAREAGFNALIACAFSFEAHTTEFSKLGDMPVLKARMNADLHMAAELADTDKANLFVIFGEPDLEIERARWIQSSTGRLIAPIPKNEPGAAALASAGAWKKWLGGAKLEDESRSELSGIKDFPLKFTEEEFLRVKVKGVDVFHPASGEVRSDDTDGIACWFIDTNYNSESFFVRQAYFLGANDPYKSLKTSLKAEIDKDAWESLHSAISRPFRRPKSGRIAVKVINHLGDEVMKVFRLA